MNHANSLAQHDYLSAQWFECSIDIRGVVDSNTVGVSDFYFVPRSQHGRHFVFWNKISSFLSLIRLFTLKFAFLYLNPFDVD